MVEDVGVGVERFEALRVWGCLQGRFGERVGDCVELIDNEEGEEEEEGGEGEDSVSADENRFERSIDCTCLLCRKVEGLPLPIPTSF